MPKKKASDPVEIAELGRDGHQLNTFTFSSGRVVRLNRLGEAILTGLMSDSGKPQPPKREVAMAGGGKGYIDRREDEPFLSEAEVEAIRDPKQREDERVYRQFRLDLQAFTTHKGLLFAKTIFLLGVEDWPTAEESAIWRAIGFSDPFDIKYMWLALLCAELEEWNRFIEAVMSFSMPTEEGIAEMQELFPGAMAGPPAQALGVAGHLGSGAAPQTAAPAPVAPPDGDSG